MTKVLATGTFDILHPGHVHYLRESASHGDELVVIVSRESMVSHKEPPVLPGKQRREMVEALEVVDRAVLGSEDSIFDPLHEIRPDVVTLGHDQHYDEKDLREDLRERGFDAEVIRVTGRNPTDEEILSTSSIVEKVIKERG